MFCAGERKGGGLLLELLDQRSFDMFTDLHSREKTVYWFQEGSTLLLLVVLPLSRVVVVH